MEINVTSSILGKQGENRVSFYSASAVDALPAAGPWRGESDDFCV